jgi:HlyD family secretion protein
MSRKSWLVVVALLGLAVAGTFYFERAKADVPKYRAVPVDSGTVTATVTATGSLSAVTTVAVGSQVSGIIARLHADFNSRVKKGQLLAELDPTPFQEALDQQRANLLKAKSDLALAEVNLGRQKKLRDLQLIAASDYDTVKAQRDDAAAVVKQVSAALKQAETNLSYTQIKAPIDGVVVDRQYNVGQTVAASFQAPTLFSIAQDLTKMQVLTNIDEADIGGIKVGQAASFSVDAYPDQTFHAAVAQIRLSTQTVQNVVTYPVMLDVPNPDGKLMPGMTANVVVPVDTRRNALRVPNAALRFKPDEADVLRSPGDNVAGGMPAGGTSPGEPAAGRGTGGSGSEANSSGGTGSGGSSSERNRSGATGPSDTSPGEPGGRAGRSGSSAGSGPGAAGGPGGAGGPGEGGGPGGGGSLGGPGGPGGSPGGPGAAGSRAGGPGRRTSGTRNTVVYVLASGSNKLRPVRVSTSITDGTFTAVRSRDLKAGDQVVVGLQTARASAPGAPPGGGARGVRF